MRFRLQRETFLKPLAHVVNVVERRQTRSILANLLIKVNEDQLSLTGTDLEVEMISKTIIEDAESGRLLFLHVKFMKSLGLYRMLVN